jgi:phosphatidylglycerol:prolipoprotein diacylglycerol transferase
MTSLLFSIPYPNIDPVLFRVGPLAFRWYGLMYLLGLTAAYFLIRNRAAVHQADLSKDQLYDLIVYAAFGVFLGGRFGYTLFYNFKFYAENPLKIFAVWEGGMSFHGGLLGVIVAIVWFCRRRGLPVFPIGDLAALSAPIGLGLGRLGNFINGELYGRATDVDWCMEFPNGGGVCRHPSQLYEAGLEGVLLFVVLWMISLRRTPPGTIFWSFIAGYGLCRFIVEFFREPDYHLGYILGPFSMGQLLSVPMILLGAVMIAWGYQKQVANRG